MKREYAAQQVRTWILAGTYKPGERLPSTRHLCEILEVGKTVVADAMRDLVREGYVRTVVGGSRYVADRSGWPDLGLASVSEPSAT